MTAVTPVQHMTAGQQRASGEARLVLKPLLGRTRIGALYQEGCAKLRFPRCGDREAFEAVLINTSGGLTGGDRLRLSASIGPGCRAQMTTQACEKIYKASAGEASVSTEIEVGRAASFAWLPQETIVFDRSALDRSLDVRLAGDASALIVEAVAFGRKAMGERVARASFRDRWRIWRDGRMIHAEDLRVGPDFGLIAGRPALLSGAGAIATVLLAGDGDTRHLDAVRSIIGENGIASAWSGKLLARLFDTDAYSLRKRLVPLIRLLNGKAGLPRAWSI